MSYINSCLHSFIKFDPSSKKFDIIGIHNKIYIFPLDANYYYIMYKDNFIETIHTPYKTNIVKLDLENNYIYLYVHYIPNHTHCMEINPLNDDESIYHMMPRIILSNDYCSYENRIFMFDKKYVTELLSGGIDILCKIPSKCTFKKFCCDENGMYMIYIVKGHVVIYKYDKNINIMADIALVDNMSYEHGIEPCIVHGIIYMMDPLRENDMCLCYDTKLARVFYEKISSAVCPKSNIITKNNRMYTAASINNELHFIELKPLSLFKNIPCHFYDIST